MKEPVVKVKISFGGLFEIEIPISSPCEDDNVCSLDAEDI